MEQNPSVYRLDQPWYPESILCDWLFVSRHTVRRWRKRGLPCIGRGRLRRYNLAEVLAWVETYDTKLR